MFFQVFEIILLSKVILNNNMVIDLILVDGAYKEGAASFKDVDNKQLPITRHSKLL